MKPPFRILVLYGDGSRVLRFGVPRWIAYGMLGVAGTAAAAAIGFAGGYAAFDRQRSDLVVLRARVKDQQTSMDVFQRRVAAVRREIATWRTLHAKMWRAFGPETGADRAVSGMGGGIPIAMPVSLARQASELDLLVHTVAEEGQRLRELERLVRRTGRMIDALPLRWPVRGRVNSEYGRRRSPWSGKPEQHLGLDIGAPPGTPVLAPAAGTIVGATASEGYGRHVTVDHGNGVRSRYAHLRKLGVTRGQRVERGDVIGLVGSSGRSTGPHLHYEIRVEGKPVDPRGFLWER